MTTTLSARGGGGAKPTDTPTTARANAEGVTAAKPIASAMQHDFTNFMNGSSRHDHGVVIGIVRNALGTTTLTLRGSGTMRIPQRRSSPRDEVVRPIRRRSIGESLSISYASAPYF
jgi:hypothetical protein